MTGYPEGKVAFIAGAARGQERAHAVRMADEGGDIIAVETCRQIESNPYPLSSSEDRAGAKQQVKVLGRRIVAQQADVRVVADAGILPLHPEKWDAADFVGQVDVDLLGALNAIAAALPQLPDGPPSPSPGRSRR